jgi:hypothetical protein
MNSPMISQLATQHVSETRAEAGAHRAAAAAREARESLRERAGWTLIHVGLKLTGPPAQGRHAGPHPASL